ncbi:putative receptor-like protein kinase At4g00960 [Panicum virgatum]|uniref:putative receptor-like protein kinase At4g00960 n=1 Tax=Panicum virgatum TaxID=38727 RepID=UPI0019D5F06F|nr:putative receptor-like protein kinase At4g00960 [Panicum virgatum]
MELEDLSFQFLREITDDFSEKRKLGEGAFGVVYKGVTKNGDDVAVKKLKFRDINLDFEQFQNEFYNLKKLNHQNIVRILGYCYEIEKKPDIMLDGSKVFGSEIHKAFCFEYLHNGSLEKHLSDEFCELDWHTKFKIIKGTCEGLKYIHEERIHHLDLKPDNILLDKDMVPKIADFGLSRFFDKELARTSQHPYGTRGYQPPEYIDKGEISEKFDIFSLGVVIIKIVSGPKGYPKFLDMSSDEFIDQVRRDWRNRLEATCTGDLLEAYCHQVETCTRIALNCLETDSQKRPNIMKTIEKLNELEVDTGKEFIVNNVDPSMIDEPKNINQVFNPLKLLSGKECLDNESQKICSCLQKLLPGMDILIVLDDLWDDHQFRLEKLKGNSSEPNVDHHNNARDQDLADYINSLDPLDTLADLDNWSANINLFMHGLTDPARSDEL